MPDKTVPDIVVGRLPLYLRTLRGMESQGRLVTSSQELGEHLGISAAQIRKDLSLFGEFGKQGTGYNIPYLAEQISEILHINRVWEMVIVGAGDIGHAVARYQGFKDRGFRVAMVFDNDPSKIGTQVGGHIVQDFTNLVGQVQRAGIRVAMLAVPASQAQDVANQLIQAGIKAILNYAPVTLRVPVNVHVQQIDPAIQLQHMAYYLE
jgi:redox-sensing transcriptional repressor